MYLLYFVYILFQRILISRQLMVSRYLLGCLLFIILWFLVSLANSTVISSVTFFFNVLAVVNLVLTRSYKFKSLNYDKIFGVISIFFIFEAVLRLSNPAQFDSIYIERLEANSLLFQIYKVNSFMYQDSNFVSIHLLLLLTIYIILKVNNSENPRNLIVFIYTILIFATLSRASILCVTLLLHIKYGLSLRLILTRCLFGIYLSFMMYLAYVLVQDDLSLISKMKLLNEFTYFMYNFNNTDLFFV